MVASYDASGAHRWSKRYGGTGEDGAFDVAVAPGQLYVSGYAEGTPDFGGGPRPTNGGSIDFMLLRLAP